MHFITLDRKELHTAVEVASGSFSSNFNNHFFKNLGLFNAQRDLEN